MIKGKFRYNVGGLWIDRTYETMELINHPDEALILKDINIYLFIFMMIGAIIKR